MSPEILKSDFLIPLFCTGNGARGTFTNTISIEFFLKNQDAIVNEIKRSK